jgi:hypothetical protein
VGTCVHPPACADADTVRGKLLLLLLLLLLEGGGGGGGPPPRRRGAGKRASE